MKNLIRSIILFFEPSLVIQRKDWLRNWVRKENLLTIFSAKILCACLCIIYLLHYPLVDVPAKKIPLELWFNYRMSVAIVSFLGLILYYNINLYNTFLIRIPAYIVVLFTVYMQGRSMIWRQEVPFFYVPLLAFIGTIFLKLSPGKSLIVFISIISVTYEVFTKRKDDVHHLLSASIVASLILVMFRNYMKIEISNFILENENKENQEKLIQNFIDFQDQLKKFIPKKIFHRIEKLILTENVSPLEAIDVILRPKKAKAAILFSDIRGFTKLIKIKGDIAAINAIMPAQKICTDIIENENGIPKLQGDLIYAYYDSDNVEENIKDVLISAIRLLEETALLNKKLESEKINILRFIIITYGEVITGNLGGTEGSRDITVLGNAANLPSRIDAITKIDELKDLIENHPIILSNEMYEAYKICNIDVDFLKFDLINHNIILKDFEDEKYLYLIPIDKIHLLKVKLKEYIRFNNRNI